MLNGFNKPQEQSRKHSGSNTSRMNLIKAQVLHQLADAAEPFVPVPAALTPDKAGLHNRSQFRITRAISRSSGRLNSASVSAATVTFVFRD